MWPCIWVCHRSNEAPFGLWLILGVVYGLAAGYRLQILNIIEVGSDTFSPLWAAMGVLHHGWANPPNPESDHWLWGDSFAFDARTKP